MNPYINFANPQPYNPGRFVTQAFPENGRDDRNISYPGGPRTSQRTQDYIDFLREADARGGHGVGNGSLTRNEARAQISVYRRQLNTLHNGSYGSPIYSNLIESLNTKIRVGNSILQNFSSISGRGSSSGSGNGITQADLRATANQDGNPYNITNRDIHPVRNFLE